MYVIGARTGQGKTSLALQFAGTAIANRVPPLLFSMEMGHRDAFQRMAGIEARADLTRYAWLRKHHPTSLDAKDMERDLRQATEKFSRVPFYVTTKTGVTPEFLIQESKRMKERAGVGLVIVDHMQLMGASGRVKGDYEKFTAISRRAMVSACSSIVLFSLSRTSSMFVISPTFPKLSAPSPAQTAGDLPAYAETRGRSAGCPGRGRASRS